MARALHLHLTGGGFDVHLLEGSTRLLAAAQSGTAPDLIILESTAQAPASPDLCRSFKADSRLQSTTLLIIDVSGDADDIALVNAGADDIIKGQVPADQVAARAKSLVRLRSLSDDRDDVEEVLHALARTIEAKDPHTLGHADRVAQYAIQLGKAMGVNEFDAQTLRKGGMLHDIGKIAIPDSILLKPGRYTPEEFAVMKRHPSLGCEICGKLASLQDALPLIRHHHEKLDGSGYPDGLKDGAIPPLVRIVSLVDIYDALRSRRSYKDAYSIDQTFGIMWEEAGKGWWDKDILAAWENLIRTNKKVANDD